MTSDFTFRGTVVRAVAAAIGGLVALVWLGFTAQARAQDQDPQGPPPAIVEVAEASDEMMAPQVFMPGTVVSRNDSRIASEISGRVIWVADEGVRVAEGDVIAEIDDRNLRLAVARGAAQIKRLEARITYLRSDLKRVQELAETNHTPISRAEEAESTLAMTEQELAEARISLEQAEIDMKRTRVRAPFPGRVVARLAQIGEYSTPGREIVRLVDTEHLEVRAQAPVALSAVLTDGLGVTLRRGNNSVDSRIRALIPVGDEQSRSMEIRVDVPAAGDAMRPGGIYVVGAAVQVGLPSSVPEKVVAVPRDALVLRSEGTYVYRINEDNMAERLLVRPGAAKGGRVAVAGGVESGDRVVIRGGERLRPGQPVTLREIANGR